MKICKTGRVITKTRRGEDVYFLRLNLIDDAPDGQSRKYFTKDIPTELRATKRNFSKANVLLEDAIAGYNADAEKMYVHHYLERWLASKRPSLEIISYEGYQYRIGLAVDYFKEQRIKLADLKPENIRDYYNHLLTLKHGKGKREKIGYSNRSIKDAAIILRSALSDAVLLKYIPESPAARIKAPKRNEEREDKAFIGAEDVDVFFEAIKGHRLEVVFKLILFYGLRREEACGLRWRAIRNGRIYIEHTVAHMRTTVAKDRTKTNASYRSYPIPDEIMEKLKHLKDQQEDNRLTFGNAYMETDYCFTWPDGHPYSPDYLTKSFKDVVRSNDMLDDSLTLHSLRASCVSILVHNGVDIKDVQAWVGHSDIATTMNIYARTNEARKTATADSMAGTLFKRKPENS